MVNLGHKLIKCVIQSLCPGPSKALLERDVVKKLSRGHEVLGTNSDEARYEKMSNALCLCTKMSKKNSVERRICRALLYHSVTGTDHLQELLNKHKFTFSRGVSRKTARLDYKLLCKGEQLVIEKRYFLRIDDDVLKKAVSFILSEDNCISMSYGCKLVRLSDNERVQLPRFQRKKPRIDIVKDYLKFTMNDETNLSQRSMYNILNLITATDQASLYAIDYVTSLLVNETAEVIQDMIDKLLPIDEGKHVSRLLYTASYFLKHKYKHHIVLDDGVCYHGLSHALTKKIHTQQLLLAVTNTTIRNTNISEGNESNTSHDITTTNEITTTNTTNSTTIEVNAWKFPFFVCSTIK